MVSRRRMGRNYPWVIDEEWPGIIHRLSMTNWTELSVGYQRGMGWNYMWVIDDEWDGITLRLSARNGTELTMGYQR